MSKSITVHLYCWICVAVKAIHFGSRGVWYN